MTKRRVMHVGDSYVIQEYYRGEWADMGEVPTIEQAKALLKDLKKLDKEL